MSIEIINNTLKLNIPLLNLALPVGISFFTFQAMSYVIDVYRKDVKPETNLFRVMLYISFFPQLIAGPIVKYHDIDQEIRERFTSPELTAKGMRRFIIGLSKKVLIANVMAQTADTIFALSVSQINIGTAWLGALTYLFQIYFDFSGYSDMAIGLGHMFGFHFKENFNYPYISCSIKEFWRRWHISLSTWFKEYLYIPLGGNRKGKARTSINKMIVFFTTGLWHGANFTFILWGLWHGFFLLAEERVSIKKFPRILQHVYVLLIVIVGFVMFRAESVTQGIDIISKMFTGWNFTTESVILLYAQITPLLVFSLILAIVFSMPILQYFKQKESKVLSFGSYAGCFALLIVCMLNLSSGTYNPFIYFRF
ncbi:MBOAT family O-acyltransferase [Erysipelotrichaceae bacterium 66-17]